MNIEEGLYVFSASNGIVRELIASLTDRSSVTLEVTELIGDRLTLSGSVEEGGGRDISPSLNNLLRVSPFGELQTITFKCIALKRDSEDGWGFSGKFDRQVALPGDSPDSFRWYTLEGYIKRSLTDGHFSIVHRKVWDVEKFSPKEVVEAVRS